MAVRFSSSKLRASERAEPLSGVNRRHVAFEFRIRVVDADVARVEYLIVYLDHPSVDDLVAHTPLGTSGASQGRLLSTKPKQTLQ